ncbi:pyridoxamine 5'-phosphate oxidase family protein [Crateriforma conspicua]|uniref:Pyridoxamine 5'-phosphate oxidase n=1 Tax=Crateriforma conspicua TaxID=2527996 RepID=A0A5C5Y1J3_9PLAN|nr:pyridoxamine 5'-phosphate oxidase family protein [Crateriforma conspicua]QDV64066.1 Pyridoxamine 5'-phosphate oxidase [Crateriforma conspicua]TWT69457.1 Pyridoxamine 5'-phosphate oxidase [Crateriforma conspicua]
MNTEEKLVDIIQSFDNAMLVTKTDDAKLHGRPMAIAEATEDGQLWFVTDRSSGKIADLMLDSDVAVTFQSDRRFATVSGQCHVVDDQAKIEDLWKEAWKVWFPGGPSDPSLTLLRVDPEIGEYWDNSGLSGVRYLIKAGKAYLQGDTPETDDSINATVDMK